MQILAGYGLAAILTLFVAAEIVCHKWIKKVTNNYFFWLAISIFVIVWSIVFRYSYYANWYAQELATGGIIDPGCHEKSTMISYAFMLDVCPLTAFLIPIALVVDPTRKIARSMCPIALLGAIAVIYLQMPFNDTFEFTAKYIFIGTSERLYFFYHAVNILIPVGVLLNTPRFGWKGTLSAYIATAVIFLYVGIASVATGCMWENSGVTLLDFDPIEGQYRTISGIIMRIFGFTDYRFVGCVFWPWMGLNYILVIHFNDYVMKRTKTFGYLNQKGKPWYNWYQIKK